MDALERAADRAARVVITVKKRQHVMYKTGLETSVNARTKRVKVAFKTYNHAFDRIAELYDVSKCYRNLDPAKFFQTIIAYISIYVTANQFYALQNSKFLNPVHSWPPDSFVPYMFSHGKTPRDSRNHPLSQLRLEKPR